MDTEDILAGGTIALIVAILFVVLFNSCSKGPEPVPISMVNLKVEDLKKGEGGWIDTSNMKSWSGYFQLDNKRRLHIHDDVHVISVEKPLERDWGKTKFPGKLYIFIYKSSQGLIMTIYEPFFWEVDRVGFDYNKVQLVVKKDLTSKDKIPSFGEDKLKVNTKKKSWQ